MIPIDEYSGETDRIFDADKNTSYEFDSATGRLSPAPVKYIDKCQPWEEPRVPEPNWQQLFANTVREAVAEFNKTADIGFVPDETRKSGFKGAGIINANVTFFFKRKDKLEGFNADFCIDFRANEYVTWFRNGGGQKGIYDRVIHELAQIEKKKD